MMILHRLGQKKNSTITVGENGADAAQIPQPSGIVPPEQLRALKEVLDESKKKSTSDVDLG
jgi:hypothetical protein